MGLFDNLTYAFSGSAPAGDPGSPQALETRRKIALAMIGRDRKGYPKNVGEGLTAIGDALGERSQLAQLDAQQAAFDKWGIEHPPPRASSMMGQPPAAAAPAATGPRADASPQMPTVAPVQTADASAAPPPEAAAPLLQAAANNDAYQPADALPPIQDAGGAPQLASADTGTMNDAAPVGVPTGQPNPAAVRASIAQLMQARQGGPQPNPMLAGQSPANTPSAISPDPALLGSPLEPNRPIETGIKPVQVAQAAGTAPSIPEINRVTPPVTMPPPGPVQQPPNAPYNQMEKDGADLEQWGNQRGDERYIKQGQLLQKLGKEQRDRENADLQEKYRQDRQLESQRVIEQQRAEQGKGVAQQQLEEATSKAADARRANRFGGGVAYQQFVGDVSKSYDATQQLSNTLPTLQQAKQALAQSYTGKGAEIKLDANKMLRVLGVPGDYTPAVATEMLQSRMKAIAGGLIKSTVGSQNISDADREFVEKAYSGTISMEPESLRRLLGIAEDTTIRSINRHNDRLIGVAKHPDDAVLRDQYQVPMQYGDSAVTYLKAHPETADLFDKKFGKGHAKAVLQGTPYGQ